jgi:hypothetical protein
MGILINGVGTLPDVENHIRQLTSFPASSPNFEDVDTLLAPIFKDVLEHDGGREFTHGLDTFIQEKTAQIENLSNSNQEVFCGAVEKLPDIREAAARLKLQSGPLDVPF